MRALCTAVPPSWDAPPLRATSILDWWPAGSSRRWTLRLALVVGLVDGAVATRAASSHPPSFPSLDTRQGGLAEPSSLRSCCSANATELTRFRAGHSCCGRSLRTATMQLTLSGVPRERRPGVLRRSHENRPLLNVPTSHLKRTKSSSTGRCSFATRLSQVGAFRLVVSLSCVDTLASKGQYLSILIPISTWYCKQNLLFEEDSPSDDRIRVVPLRIDSRSRQRDRQTITHPILVVWGRRDGTEWLPRVVAVGTLRRGGAVPIPTGDGGATVGAVRS